MHAQGHDARRLLLDSFRVAVAAADPARVLPPHLPVPPHGRTLVVGGGKAAASMAATVEAHWPAETTLSGLVVTRYHHSLPLQRIDCVEASHPLPDGRGEAAALQMLELTRQLGKDDLLLALISGGGSSLLAAPVPGVTLKELRQVTKALLHAGAPIQAINTVRKHLTRLAGGRLAQAANGAQCLALIISDVVGDDPTHIASGPCAPDPSTCADAIALLQRYRIATPASIQRFLEGCIPLDEAVLHDPCSPLSDTPNPNAAFFRNVENRVIANARASLLAAANYFEEQGIPAVLLSDCISGDAQVVAKHHAALVRALVNRHPLALISGGETTVNLRPQHGRGGRNSEFLLSLALALQDSPVWAIACDTDGIDGSEENAGALISPSTLLRAHQHGLDCQAQLESQNSHALFSSLGDLVTTGPTRTNVNDYRAILVGVN